MLVKSIGNGGNPRFSNLARGLQTFAASPHPSIGGGADHARNDTMSTIDLSIVRERVVSGLAAVALSLALVSTAVLPAQTAVASTPRF